MIFDLKPFDELVEQGYLRSVTKGPLILYTYTDKCTYDRHWNEYTRAARGIIFEKDTGILVAKPFPKFFNLGEMEETFLSNLPLSDSYSVSEKMDGSLGIIFYYDDKWQVATKGSFSSDQAVEAAKMLEPINPGDEFVDYRYDLRHVKEDITLLVEIIYPDNKIVVNYNGDRKLVLLSAYSRITGIELTNDSLKAVSQTTALELVTSHDLTIEQAVTLQKTLPKDREGFVVRFQNGLRCKIKGDEYMKIHKMISHMSPLSFWESMTTGIVNKDYLAQLPEEFRKDFEPIVAQLEQQYKDILVVIALETVTHNLKNFGDNWRKEVGLYLANNEVRHSKAMFPFLLRNNESLNKYIMNQIRPTGNLLVNID